VAKLITCWKVGRFVQRIRSGSSPPEKAIRSGWASARHAAGSEPCADWSAAPAWSIAVQSEARQAARSPSPQ
jgi:hypothetical protein